MERLVGPNDENAGSSPAGGFMKTFLIAFIVVFLMDVCWTFWFIETENRAVIKASAWSALITILSATITKLYVSNDAAIFGAALGAFVGTALTILYKKKKESHG